MQYSTVLGYTDNVLLDQYREKYFQKLLNIFASSFSDHPVLQEDEKSLKKFFLHPDISSLIQDISNPDSQEKLLQELRYFCDNEHKKLILHKGKNITETDIKLTLSDNNPQNMQVGHPDHDQDGMLGWGDKDQEEWGDVFGKALETLKDIDENFFDELNSIIKKIVPMKTSIDVHNSCSYGQCIGTLYLGYTINSETPELNILEALIHESSHNKLNLIMQSEKLHINNYEEKYYSPYRPDARHIHGVLLGVHAIVPTVYVLLQGIQKGCIQDTSFFEKALLYHIKNKLGYKVLKKYARFTTIGQQIFDDMGAVIKICDEIIQLNIQLQQVDFKAIQTRVKKHFIEVKTNYPYLQY